MFCPHKNSYLQLVCAISPRVINKAVDRAMSKPHFDPHDELPSAQRLDSMQPSLYAPHVDITRARLGFGRVGLRLINRDLHSTDNLVQLQALHSILDQVHISENAIFLINLQLVNRLIDLMLERDPVIREKVCLILTQLCNYYQGRSRMLARPKIIENILWIVMRDRNEIRYAAAYTLKSLTRDRCSSETILKNDTVVENLLKIIKNDRTGIILLHLKTLENLIEWDPERALKSNAFQIMLKLIEYFDPSIVSAAMDCMAQLCKHNVGKKLADNYDLNYVLKPYLMSPYIEIVISALGVMAFTTLTVQSKWRIREYCRDLTKRLIQLCLAPTMPLLQLRAMQVIINICECPDVRNHVANRWLKKVMSIEIRTHEQWDGTSETTSYGLETGHNYRTMCIENVETIKNDYGDNARVVNVHSYLRRLQAKKETLLRAIQFKSYKNASF